MRELKGRHVAAMFVGGFGIIIGVNLILATSAVRSFPGLEVVNSYVASQSFNARKSAQDALGWTVSAEYDGAAPGGGRLHLWMLGPDGGPAPVRGLAVHIGRPTEERDDRALDIAPTGSVALDLAPGLWRLDVTGTAPDGTAFQRALQLAVRG